MSTIESPRWLPDPFLSFFFSGLSLAKARSCCCCCIRRGPPCRVDRFLFFISNIVKKGLFGTSTSQEASRGGSEAQARRLESHVLQTQGKFTTTFSRSNGGNPVKILIWTSKHIAAALGSISSAICREICGNPGTRATMRAMNHATLALPNSVKTELSVWPPTVFFVSEHRCQCRDWS